MSAEEAAHLLRRTRFAARAEDVVACTGRSWADAIETLVDNTPDPVVPTPAVAYRRPAPDGDDTDATLLLNSEIDRLANAIGLGDRLVWFSHGVFTSSQRLSSSQCCSWVSTSYLRAIVWAVCGNWPSTSALIR
jgi:hypothetical protein